jgi:hypothetical protein
MGLRGRSRIVALGLPEAISSETISDDTCISDFRIAREE